MSYDLFCVFHFSAMPSSCFLLFLLLLLLLLTTAHSSANNTACTFSMSDIPVPSNKWIRGDPRASEACRATSFSASRPANLFDPDGLRVWTREEDILQTSTLPITKESVAGGWTPDTYKYRHFMRYAHDKSNKVIGQYILIPKTGCTTMRDLFHSFKLMQKSSFIPQAKRQDFLIAAVRHPLTRFMSGIGHLVKTREISYCDAKRKYLFEDMCQDVTKIVANIDEKGIMHNETVHIVLNLMKKWVQDLPLTEAEVADIYVKHIPRQAIVDRGRHIPNHTSIRDISDDIVLLRPFHMEPLHMVSQLFFLNSYPPAVLSPSTLNDASTHSIDVLFHLEHLEEGIHEAAKVYPSKLGFLSNAKVGQRNSHEGEKETHVHSTDTRFSCETAWAIYDYFVQDFVCLGYELPEECMREECRP